MKGSFLKIVVMLLAIAGVVAIGWYLLIGKSAMEETASTDTSVEVTRPQETATAPKPEPAPAPAPKAEEAPAPAAQAPAAPAAPANAAELAALTPEQVGERWNATSEAERTAFITDYVRAAGEANSLAVARDFSRGPVEGRNYEWVLPSKA